MGASNFTFAEATRTQTKRDFCASTVRMFEFFGATPRVAVPDQLRSAVKGPDRYDPEINPTYAELSQHYDVAIVPARAGEPRDKAKVEGGVLLAQRWILACLRNRTFFSLEDLNAAIAELLDRLNTRPFQKLEGCRRSAFETIDRPAMKPLPATRWQYSDSKRARVNIDYHVDIDGRLYSVPYQLVQELVDPALHRRDRRDLPPGQARGQPSAPVVTQGHGEHAARAPAQQPSRLRRLATVPDDRVGIHQGPPCRRAGEAHPRESPPPGERLSSLHGSDPRCQVLPTRALQTPPAGGLFRSGHPPATASARS
jgi:hypothetical protein